jgi:hypothetical protein
MARPFDPHRLRQRCEPIRKSAQKRLVRTSPDRDTATAAGANGLVFTGPDGPGHISLVACLLNYVARRPALLVPRLIPKVSEARNKSRLASLKNSPLFCCCGILTERVSLSKVSAWIERNLQLARKGSFNVPCFQFSNRRGT